MKLDETGADGLIPIRTLGQEFFHYDRDAQTLMGADTGLIIGLGQRVEVRLTEAAPVTGGLMLELLAVEGARCPARGARARPTAPPEGGARQGQGRQDPPQGHPQAPLRARASGAAASPPPRPARLSPPAAGGCRRS